MNLVIKSEILSILKDKPAHLFSKHAKSIYVLILIMCNDLIDQIAHQQGLNANYLFKLTCESLE